jgi:hypothetical protein
MAVTQNTYTGNGSTTNYSFTFPYLEETDIKVALNGTLTTAYTLANATTISFASPPANGTAIRIYRSTNNDSLQATFYPGSAIRSQDLNENFLQALYSVQEAGGSALSINGGTMLGNLDMGGNKVVNLGSGVNPGDAVNKSQLDATQNYNNAQLAASVAAAQTQATNAANSAQSATTAQQQASQEAANSATSATTASAAAASSQSNATAAAASAASAASFAGNTIFFGFSRNQNGNLILTYSSPAENTTYETSSYEYKSGSQWFIGSNDILHTSGPLLGTPKVSFNASGHLLLTA